MTMSLLPVPLPDCASPTDLVATVTDSAAPPSLLPTGVGPAARAVCCRSVALEDFVLDMERLVPREGAGSGPTRPIPGDVVLAGVTYAVDVPWAPRTALLLRTDVAGGALVPAQVDLSDEIVATLRWTDEGLHEREGATR